MKLAFYTNCVSQHVLPLARAVVRRIGPDNFRYVYRDGLPEDRQWLGWGNEKTPDWCLMGTEATRELMEADVVYTGGLRPIDMMERRAAAGKMTVYCTERWFKPLYLMGIDWPGRVRMMVPGYRKMAKRMVRLLNGPHCMCLAIGPWARRDITALGVDEGKIMPWGYFVERGRGVRTVERQEQVGVPLRVLWVGRMVRLKRVDTIIKAFRFLKDENVNGIELTLVGDGPERRRLEKMAIGLPIRFSGMMSGLAVREHMQDHDVLIMASDSHEGWGAVVNEALEEGMKVVGTYDAGASAALLNESDLFHAGNWRRLAELMMRCDSEKRKGKLAGQGIGSWTAESAAERLMAICEAGGWK